MNIIKIKQALEKEKAQLENLYELDYECWLQKDAGMDVEGDEPDQMYAENLLRANSDKLKRGSGRFE